MSAFFSRHPQETDLALFAGGELGPFARWRIERHIETCTACEQTVADFFHLSDELSPLADVPEMDWTAMARDIEARLAVETAAPAPRRGVPAWTWQVGAAAACALVAMTVWNAGPKGEKAVYAPAVAEQALADKAPGAESRADALAASAPLERDEAAPARQLARMEAAPESSLEKKKEAAEPAILAPPDRADERLVTDAAAPAPPPAAKTVSMESDSDLLLAREDRAWEDRARRPQAFGGHPAAGASVLGLAKDASVEPVFGVRPLPVAGDRLQMGADGWISVSADGAMTITQVYDPQ